MKFRRLIQRMARLTPAPVRRAVKAAVVPETTLRWLYPARGLAAKRLQTKLWGGFSRDALNDLEALKMSRTADPIDASIAAWALARWYVAEGSFARAYENVVISRLADPEMKSHMGQVLVEADCLIRLGDRKTARDLLLGTMRERPDDPNLFLAMANTYAPLDGSGDAENDELRLSWINRVYDNANLLRIARADPARPLGIDNLTAPQPRLSHGKDQPTLTVIVPVYKAEATLPFALRSLLDQTWQNLEVIVVDDCSPDDSLGIAEDFASRDARVKTLRQSTNQGSYVARNQALKIATGDFIMVHDADDWSHPQRAEQQIRHLADNAELVGNLALWARVQPNLRFCARFRPSNELLRPSHATFMFRRDAVDRVGGWDEVRVGADTEFIWRLRHALGHDSVKKLATPAPLAFAREDDRSLTQSRATHIRTMDHGMRRAYREATRYWHRSTAPQALRIEPQSPSRAFPAPGPLLPARVDHVDCDLLFIMDFNLKAGAFVSTMNYVEAAIAHGYSVALFHWRRYDLNVFQPLKRKIRQMAHEGRVRVVSPGEKVRASTVIVGYPVILRYVIDLCPEIEFDNFVVVVNQLASRLADGGDVQYDPLELRANLKTLFGADGLWVPISGRVKRIMQMDSRYPTPHSEIWVPLIDITKWCSEPLRWRGRERRRPVVGRHGRDHYTKWPATAVALRAAYCADRPCDVAILGGVDRALEVIGAKPKNWSIQKFGAADTQTFAAGLDFFLHYPNENYIEEFGRAVIEAMALGVPAILPPAFAETFGEAALYAEPAEVWDVVARLWADEDSYLRQAKAGREFVLAHCGFDQLPKRLVNLGVLSKAPTMAMAKGLAQKVPGTGEAELSFPQHAAPKG